MDGRKYYVRQMRNLKASIDPSKLDADSMIVWACTNFLRSTHTREDLATWCGCVLARAHSRTADCSKIIGYIGTTSLPFGEAIAQFAELYADQNAKDHQALVDGIKSGHVAALASV